MLEKGLPRAEVVALLDKYSAMDRHFADGGVVGSMCTAPHPLARRAHIRFLEANLGNRGLYPGTAEMEEEVVREVGALLHHPKPRGYVVSGGTEANLMAVWAARELTGAARVIMPASAHFSFRKACQLLRLEPVVIPLDADHVASLPDLDTALQSGDVACVVAVAGATETGLCDPVAEMGQMLSGRGIPLHVDAAFGGFVLPFIKRPPPFDFTVAEVMSLTIDPHKMGMGTIPGGMLLYRDEGHLSGIKSHSPYLTQREHYTLTGTRGSAGVAASFAAIKSLGRNGYARIVRRCMRNARRLVKGARALGVEPCFEPLTNVVVLDVPSPERVYASLMEKGFYASVSTAPPGLRVVVMPHLTAKTVDAFVAALGKVMA